MHAVFFQIISAKAASRIFQNLVGLGLRRGGSGCGVYERF